MPRCKLVFYCNHAPGTVCSRKRWHKYCYMMLSTPQQEMGLELLLFLLKKHLFSLWIMACLLLRNQALYATCKHGKLIAKTLTAEPLVIQKHKNFFSKFSGKLCWVKYYVISRIGKG
jgi:hypothetical protein